MIARQHLPPQDFPLESRKPCQGASATRPCTRSSWRSAGVAFIKPLGVVFSQASVLPSCADLPDWLTTVLDDQAEGGAEFLAHLDPTPFVTTVGGWR